MALPTLTPEQRSQALAKAADARQARAEFKAELKTGALSPQAGLDKALADSVLQKTKVQEFIEALPKFGKVKATEVMTQVGIAENRRLRGLGAAQIRDLLAVVDPDNAKS